MTQAPPAQTIGSTAEPPWLSVLVPAWNVAPYVDAMLRSVTTQADDGVEIVVVDDASTDATVDVVERHAAVDARVRLVRTACNAGVAAARNRLLDAARGRYLWFVDADDRMLPGALQHARGILGAAPLDLLACDFRVIGRAYRIPRRRRTFVEGGGCTSTDALLAGVLEAGQMHLWSRIVHRDLWSGLRFPERRRFEDMSVLAELLVRARSWRHVPEAWIGYRERPGSLSRDVPLQGLREFSEGLCDVHAIIRPHARAGGPREALEYFRLRGHASIARRLQEHAGRDDSDVAERCRAHFHRAFPDRAKAALAACRRRGWWLRARRIENALVRAAWR